VKFRILFALVLIPLILVTTGFQSFAPTGEPIDPAANVSFPPPIYLLRGNAEIRGTVNPQGLIGYFVEFRALNADFTPQEERVAWVPATLPVNTPVLDGVLGVWDTTLVEDGAYEIRLTVISGGGTTHARVSPLRVENEVPAFIIVNPTAFPQVAQPTFAPIVQPTAIPTTPQASPAGNADVNVRTGDGTNFPLVAPLRVGQSAEVIGVSARGTGWFQIRLPNGSVGWVSSSVVTVTGDTSTLPRVNPPAPPAPTATPFPTSTPAPSLPDASITNVRYDRSIKQNEDFNFIVTVINLSPVPLSNLVVACNFTPMNQFFSTTLGSLGGNTQVDVAVTARLTSGGGNNITASCAVDVNNIIAETNEANNFFNLTSFLAAP